VILALFCCANVIATVFMVHLKFLFWEQFIVSATIAIAGAIVDRHLEVSKLKKMHDKMTEEFRRSHEEYDKMRNMRSGSKEAARENSYMRS